MDNVYISRTGVNKLIIRKSKKIPAPDENAGGTPITQLQSKERSASVANTVGSSYNVFTGVVHGWTRDPSPTGESSSSSSVGGLSIGGTTTLLKCSISEMSPSSLVLPSPKDSGVDVNSPCHRGDEEGVMSLGGVVHVGDGDVIVTPNGPDSYHRGSGLRNSNAEGNRVVVKQSHSKYANLDPPSRQSSSNRDEANHPPSAQRSQSPFIIKRHRDSSIRIGFNANSADKKSFNSKSVTTGSTDANSRDIYGFDAVDSISPTAKLTKARKVQRPTNLQNLNDELPADSKPLDEPTPARTGFRFFSGDRRRSNVADNAAVRLLRAFTGVNNGEKKGVDKKIISSDKRSSTAVQVVTPAIDTPKESDRKYRLVPIAKPDVNKLIIKFSMAGQQGAMGNAAASGQTSLTGKFESALSNIKKARSIKVKGKSPPLALSARNNLKGKSKGLASRSTEVAVAVRDPLLGATYRPSRLTLSTTTVKEPITLNSKSLAAKDSVVLNSASLSVKDSVVLNSANFSSRQSQSRVDSLSAAEKQRENIVITARPEVSEVPAINLNSKSKQSYSVVKQLPAEKVLSEKSENVAIERRIEDAPKMSFKINLRTTTTAKLFSEESNVIAQTIVEKTNSEMKNLTEVRDEKIKMPKDIGICPKASEHAASTAGISSREMTGPGTELNNGNIIPSSRNDSAAVKIDEQKVPPLTINKISLSIKRASTGSWYVPESSKEQRRREHKLKKLEKCSTKYPNEHREDPSGDVALHDTTSEKHNSISLPEKLVKVEAVARLVAPNTNLMQQELSSTSALISRENYSSTAFPVELKGGNEPRENDQVQSFLSKDEKEPAVRLEHDIRSNLDICNASNIPDDAPANAQSTSMKLTTTHKKSSRKHGKKIKNGFSILPSVEYLAESVAKPAYCAPAVNIEIKVPMEKKIVKLTRPWEDEARGLSVAKVTTSTSVVDEMRDMSMRPRIGLIDECKPEISTLLHEEERVCFSYSDSSKGERSHHAAAVRDSQSVNDLDERNKTTDPYSFSSSSRIDDDDGGDSDNFVKESIHLSPVARIVEKSTEKGKISMTPPHGAAVNGKRKRFNFDNLNAIAEKRSKVVANNATSALAEFTEPLVTCATNDDIAHKLDVAAVQLSNECAALAKERKCKASENITFSFKFIDQLGEDVEQRLQQNVADGVDRLNTRVNPVAVKSFNSVSTGSLRLIYDGVSHETSEEYQERSLATYKGMFINDESRVSADKELERNPVVNNCAFKDAPVAAKINCIENGVNEPQTVVKFQLQAAEEAKSSLLTDDRPTLHEREVIHAETGRPICSPPRGVSVATPDAPNLLQKSATSPTAANEKFDPPIRREKSTVKRKYIKAKVQPCELTMPTCPAPAISTLRISRAACSRGPAEVPVLGNRYTQEILESSSGGSILYPKAQLSQNHSSLTNILEEKFSEELISRNKRKETDSNKASVFPELRETRCVNLTDAISPFERGASVTINGDPKSHRKKLPKYSFNFNDDDSDNDANVSSPCNINTPSPSSSPRLVVKDVISAVNTDNFDLPTFKITNETYSSKKTKKEKVPRLSDTTQMTNELTQEDNEQRFISDRDSSKASACFPSDVSPSNNFIGSMTSLETLTPPPSACGAPMDLTDNCGTIPTNLKDGRFSCENANFASNELRTSSGAVLDVEAVSEFTNVDQYSVDASLESSKRVGNHEEKSAKEEELQKNGQQELAFHSDLSSAFDTAYMDIVSSLSLGDATPFLDISGTSRSNNVRTDREPTKREPSLKSGEKLSICRPWSDSVKAAFVKDIEELEQQSRLFENVVDESMLDSTTGKNGVAGGEYDPLDIDSIIRNICNEGAANGGDAAAIASASIVANEESDEQFNSSTDLMTARPTDSLYVDLASSLEPTLEPLVLSSFDPSTLCGLDEATMPCNLAIGEPSKTGSLFLADCRDAMTKDLLDSSSEDVEEAERIVQENKSEHKEVVGKSGTCIGYLGAFAKFIQCSGDPVSSFDDQSRSSADANECKDEAAMLDSDNSHLNQITRRLPKKKTNRNFVENNYCASPLSTDLDDSRLFTTAGVGNNQVTRRNSRIFRRSTLLKQMCRIRNGSGDDEGTGTDSDHTSTRSNCLSSVGRTRDKRRKELSKVSKNLEQVNEEVTIDLVNYDDIRSIAQLTQKVNDASVVAENAVKPIEDSFVSVQLELVELEASVRQLFDVMFSGSFGMGGFSIIPKIFSASVSESGSSGVEQLLDAICTILGGDEDANKTSDDTAHTTAKSSRGKGSTLGTGDLNRQPLSHADGVIMLCNQPQSCLARLERKIATVLTLVLPDLALNADEIYRDENVGELLQMVISANTSGDSSSWASSSVRPRSDCSSVSFIAGRDVSSSQLTTTESSKFTSPPLQSSIPECLDATRRLKNTGDLSTETRLDIAKVAEKKTVSGGFVDTRDRSLTSNKSRKTRVSKNENNSKGRTLPSHDSSENNGKGRTLPSYNGLPRNIPTEQKRTNRT